MARKTKLTPETIAMICKGVASGLTYEQSARFAGIHPATFYAWKAKGEKAKSGRFVEFYDALKRANVKARLWHLQNINAAAQGGRKYTEEHVIERPQRDPATGDIKKVIVEKKTITRETLPNWVPSAWILERRFPDEFGRFVQPSNDDSAPDPMQDWIDALNEAEAEYGNESYDGD